MSEDYEVQPGDCMSSIAFEHGFFWKTLWNLPQNAALKTKRKNPNVLMTGDSVYIPDLTVKEQPGPVDQQHKFVLKGTPEVLHMRMTDAKKQPRPNLDYLITIEGITRRGKTDGDGRLREAIPPHAKTGKLVIPGIVDATGRKTDDQVLTLRLGNLNPISEVSGVKARLKNLRFYFGPVDENLDDNTKRAIRAFQSARKLPVTGAADDATKEHLQQAHGH